MSIVLARDMLLQKDKMHATMIRVRELSEIGAEMAQQAWSDRSHLKLVKPATSFVGSTRNFRLVELKMPAIVTTAVIAMAPW